MKVSEATKTLKSGVIVKTFTYTHCSESYYYYQGKQLAWLAGDKVLYYNSKYWRNEEVHKQLSPIFSLIRRRAKPARVSEYMNA